MTQIEKVLYTAKVHTKGGRDGASRSTDGPLDIKLSTPGTTGSGTNPEQLFAAGWSACFEGAMGLSARKMRITLPPGKSWLGGRALAPYRRDSWIDLDCAPRWQHRFPERTLVRVHRNSR